MGSPNNGFVKRNGLFDWIFVRRIRFGPVECDEVAYSFIAKIGSVGPVELSCDAVACTQTMPSIGGLLFIILTFIIGRQSHWTECKSFFENEIFQLPHFSLFFFAGIAFSTTFMGRWKWHNRIAATRTMHLQNEPNRPVWMNALSSVITRSMSRFRALPNRHQVDSNEKKAAESRPLRKRSQRYRSSDGCTLHGCWIALRTSDRSVEIMCRCGCVFAVWPCPMLRTFQCCFSPA